MAFQKLEIVPGDGNKWAYVCDTESDLSNAPTDALIALVLVPDLGKSQKRVKNSAGVWKEVK